MCPGYRFTGPEDGRGGDEKSIYATGLTVLRYSFGTWAILLSHSTPKG